MSEGDPPSTESTPTSGPIPLDALVYGIDLLDAVLVIHLGDASIYAAWVRPDLGTPATDMAMSLRDSYRVTQLAARRIAPDPRDQKLGASPLVTMELPLRTAIVRRLRAYIVACLFDATAPLGMARLIASRLADVIEPELPLDADRARADQARAPIGAGLDHPPITLSFGRGRSQRPPPAPPRAAPSDQGRPQLLLAYYDARAPHPHIARHRLALRAGVTPAALDAPDDLAPDALVLIEAAVEDLLGLDRAALRRIV